MAAILQPFTQADDALSRKYEGTGLGLALTQRLAQMHGAELEIDSAPDAGTTVRVLFPAERTLGSRAADAVACDAAAGFGGASGMH